MNTLPPHFCGEFCKYLNYDTYHEEYFLHLSREGLETIDIQISNCPFCGANLNKSQLSQILDIPKQILEGDKPAGTVMKMTRETKGVLTMQVQNILDPPNYHEIVFPKCCQYCIYAPDFYEDCLCCHPNHDTFRPSRDGICDDYE